MRGVAAYFFVGNQQDCERTRQVVFVPGTQSLNRVKHEGDAGFHIEGSRAVRAAVGDAERHGVQSSERVNRVQMTEQHDGLGAAFSGEIDLQMIAEVRGLMKL